MIEHILEILARWIIGVETAMGAGGIVLLMGIESACIPLPSEVIMPFAGYLADQGAFSIWTAGFAGAVGCVLGSWVAYYVGKYGGRPFIEKYGHFLLVNPGDLETADRLFARYGEIVTFFSRLLPVVRTFIAFPAGVARMNLLRFSIYTFAGSLPWCLGLAWLGHKLGQNWTHLHSTFHQMDLVIAAFIVLGGVFWARHHFVYLRSVAKT